MKITGFDVGANYKHRNRKGCNTHVADIGRKVGLLNWAEELGNVSKACQVMGFSRDAFYRYKNAPNLKNRLDPATEAAVIACVLAYPAHGQARASNELRKRGLFISSSSVRSIWLRHDRVNFKQRLKALSIIS